MERTRRTRVLLWAVTGCWIAVVVLSLHFGWLDRFFYQEPYTTRGIDFFPVPRAGANLLAGRSAYDTFHSDYGPRSTWFLYHPLAAVLLGLPLALLQPWTAFWAWTALSFSLMALCAWLITRDDWTSPRTPVVFLLLLCAFPTYTMLDGGNLQALLVLSLTLIFVAVDRMHKEGPSRGTERLLLAGLLLSLFIKPVAIAMLPLLLLLRPTRKPAAWALGIYLVISAICLSSHFINPEPIAWSQRWYLATHPSVVRQTMNIYSNGLTVTTAMKDASVHWLSMVALTDFRLNSVYVFSLSRFLDCVTERSTPTALLQVPVILVLEVGLLVTLMKDQATQLRAALLTLMACSLLVFLSYGVAWEYSYTGVLPIAGVLLMQRRRSITSIAVLATGAVVWGPSLYVLVAHSHFTSMRSQALLQADRVVPVVISFTLLLGAATHLALTGPGGLLFLANTSSGAAEPEA